MADKPYYDNEGQYKRIVNYLIPGETLFAVYDCKGAGTGFVGVSDQRVIFYDQGALYDQGMSAALKKKKTMVSIPYHHVVGIAAADEGVIFSSSELIIMTAAGRFAFEFRGADKAQNAYRFIMNQILNQANPQLAG